MNWAQGLITVTGKEEICEKSANPLDAEDNHPDGQVQEEQAGDLPGNGEDDVEGMEGGDDEEEHENQVQTVHLLLVRFDIHREQRRLV